MKPNVIIAGAGGTGSQLARHMSATWDVTVVDVEPQALSDDRLACCVRHVVGDATSALVLREAGAQHAEAAVGATNNDEKNVEMLRLARDQFGVDRLYAVMRDLRWEESYHELGVELADRFRACAAALASRITGGRKVASNIGLGRGEIMEIEVLANSSVIGKQLKELNPTRWLVGAIYRDDELIVPHGDTVILEGDRVVVIGEPAIMPLIATLISSGESEFPLYYGSRVYALGGVGVRRILPDVCELLEKTSAQGFTVLVSPDEHQHVEDVCSKTELPLPLRVVKLSDRRRRALARAAAKRDVGLVVVEPQPIGVLSRIGLRRTALVRLIDEIAVPVLVARQQIPYRRVLLALAELPFSLDAARLAIDFVRMVGAELDLGVVHQPALVVGAEMRDEMEQRRREVQGMARMYNIALNVEQMEGNPIVELVRRSEDYDVIVMPYPRGRRSSLTRPDVAQNVIHLAKCSVMVMPHD